MDLEATARLHALELLLTQFIPEHLRSVPRPREQVGHAREQLSLAADRIRFDAISLDEEARLRVRSKRA